MQRVQKYKKYIQRAKELGAKQAKIISASSIVAAEWVRIKCQFGCDGYGQCLTCPPNSPTPEETRRIVACYSRALLVHGDRHTEIRKLVVALEREMFLEGYYKAFGMGAGPCELCEECADFCVRADVARPALEACGIDVFATVRSNGFPIQVVKRQGCEGNYYGIVLIE